MITQKEIDRVTQQIKDLHKMHTFTGNNSSYVMEVNGLKVGFNMPPALQSKFMGEEELVQELPPYGKRSAFLVDKFPSCPANWMLSEGKLKSYFVAAEEGRGMWLDFNMNKSHTHHLAVLISIQGVNPLTGLLSDGIRLEQYVEECPKHKKKFGPDRFCKECDFKWPKQNYIATTGTPSGCFWLDGWRTADGIIRQYILTAEKMRGVAAARAGEKRVYAIGISFFLSKEAKPIVKEVTRNVVWGSQYTKSAPGGALYTFPSFFNPVYGSKGWVNRSSDGFDETKIKEDLCSCSSTPDDDEKATVGGAAAASIGPVMAFHSRVINESEPVTEKQMGKVLERRSMVAITEKQMGQRVNSIRSHSAGPSRPVQKVTVKKLEVGAGAKISQQIYDDPNGLDYWRDIESGTIVINYADEITAVKILDGGMVSLEGHKEGMLQGVPVGN